jgi:hypothetical protein
MAIRSMDDHERTLIEQSACRQSWYCESACYLGFRKRINIRARRGDLLIDIETAPITEARGSEEAGSFRQVYSTTLLDSDGGRALEWAFVPAALLEWNEVDLDRTLRAMELRALAVLPSLSAMPAAIVAMMESGGSPEGTSARLDELLQASLATWPDTVEPAAMTFAQYAAFSAVLPVEWSPMEKVPVPDAVVGAAAAGAVAGPSLVVAAGAHGVALVLIGAAGVAVGAIAAPIVAIGGGFVAWRLLRPLFRNRGAVTE